ncbi:MAG: glycosyltransferase family 2 protein [Kiritimatiellae bacterium]|nr:glycosyltransferase family 2 protein [Kiritimatiellia bacterium]
MSPSTFRPICVVPCYRHEEGLKAFLPTLQTIGLSIVVVDDGNTPPMQSLEGVTLLRSEQNCGKGGALVLGARWAHEQGYTHMLQIDADGQHLVADAMTMLEAAKQAPQVLFSGFPVYDASVPKSREKGREVTRFFVRLETGLKREDGLCGCRVYPLAQFLQVVDHVWTRRMGFDVEVIVKWHWAGGEVRQHKVRVTYPVDGVSNFRMVKDNVNFFLLHMCLCCGRLLRLLRISR